MDGRETTLSCPRCARIQAEHIEVSTYCATERGLAPLAGMLLDGWCRTSDWVRASHIEVKVGQTYPNSL